MTIIQLRRHRHLTPTEEAVLHAQRDAYADSLRQLRKIRDMWRHKQREAVFSKAGMALYAEATQRALTMLRLHVRLTVPPK